MTDRMTDTRKQIIELIEPYMDKIKAKGCLLLCREFRDISHFEETEDGHNYTRLSIEEIVDEMSYSNDYDDFTYTGYDQFYFPIKTIGHYDITAVLKYLTYKECVHLMDYEEVIEFALPSKTDELILDYLPKKPLHLYTEQEEKDLLELLLKLK